MELGYLDGIKISWGDNDFGRGPTGTAIRTSKYKVLNSYSDQQFAMWKGEAEKRGYKSSAAFPLTIDNDTFGALNIYSEFENAFNQRESTLLQKLANDLAYGITNIRTRAEREKIMSKLSEAQRIAHIGNWELDIKNNILTWSKEIYRIFEYDPKIFSGTYEAYLDTVHPDDRNEVDFIYKNSLKTKQPYSIDHRLLFPDGRIKYVHEQCETYYDQNGNAYLSVGTVQDITNIKLAEQEELAHLQFIESLDKINRSMQGPQNLDQMLKNTLDEVLSIFDCDRAYLLFPCDPNAKTWTTPMERNNPDYPGVYEMGIELPMDSEMAQTLKILLESNEPVKFASGTKYDLPPKISERFGVKSVMAMAIYPKIGKPWHFGIQQCSYARNWSNQEEELFEEIGRRFEDSLSTFLMYSDLQASEEKYRTLIQKIQAAVVVHSIDTSILMSNSMAQNLLGLSSKEINGRLSNDPIWHFSNENGNYLPSDQFPVNIVLRTQRKLRNYVVKVHRHKYEDEIWVLVNADPVFNKEGEISQVIVTFIDITERKTAETELEEERKLFIGGPNVAFKWKSTEGWPIEYVSPNITKVFGYSPKYLTSSEIKYTNIIHPDDLEPIRNAVENYIRLGTPYFELEYRINRADGTYRWVYNFTTVVKNNIGEITHFQGHVIDITERKNTEDEIQRLNINLEKRVAERTTQLELLNKELESFSYSVSHDLRAPLYHINGFIELLREKIGYHLDDEGKHLISSIVKSTDQMSHLIDDLLSFSRMSHQEMHIDFVDMNKLITNVIHEFEPDIGYRKIEWDIKKLPVVLADEALIRLVLVNLLSNALKFTAIREKTIIKIGFWKTETENIFYIRDNGAGFDMKNVNKLFEVFQRLHSKKDFEGIGIGLPNVHRIINRHGGRIWAEGEVNKGATFYFSLPLENIEL